MKIDLHCHTKKVKSGEATTRTVTVEKFSEKIQEAGVKIVAITNHNHFDYPQFKKFKKSVDGLCELWPGVELDVIGKSNSGHLLVIANPNKALLFSKKVNLLVDSIHPDKFSTNLKSVYKSFEKCDVLYIPHFHKEPRLSDEDIEELNLLLEDKSRLFKETSDYRSLGVFSNFDYSVIIGSDNHSWDIYESSKFADIRLPVQTFEQFCLLAKKDKQIINTLLNSKKSNKITVSPHKDVKIQIPIFEDVNILFGQKGTGKSEIIKSIKAYYDEKSILNKCYVGSEKENDFSKILNTAEMKRDTSKFGIIDLTEEFLDIYNWSEELPTSLDSYFDWVNTRENNKNKNSMKITNSVKIEGIKIDKKIDKDFKKVKAILIEGLGDIEFDRYLSDTEVENLKSLFNKLCSNINQAKIENWNEHNSLKLTNWSIDKIKSIADKCSDTVSRPSTTGFSEFVNNRIKLYESVESICNVFEIEEKYENEYLGKIEEKGDVFIRSKYRLLCSDSRANEFITKITKLRQFKKNIDELRTSISNEKIYEVISAYKELYEDGIKNISCFIGVSKDIVLENGESYSPSSGERGILLLQSLLDSDCDVYLLDEPELGMGNSFINNSILPQIVNLAKSKKTIIIATHNANIAVRTLPYMSILRSHNNGNYKTYIGNPFYDELVNINDGSDVLNWTVESMHTLEGGRFAFYERKDIYESGRKNY